MKNIAKKILFIALLTITSACGGSSHHRETVLPIGEWNNITKIIISDEVHNCMAVSPDNFTFEDFQTIEQVEEDTYMITSNIGMIDAFGAVDDNNNLTFSAEFEGDIFGDGSYCTYQVKLTYIQSGESIYETMYSRNVACDDGYICEDKGIGQSTPANL